MTEATMSDNKPSIEPFQEAIRRLKEGLADYEKNKGYDLIRDGLIQRFEFTYESACTTLARYLQYASLGNDEIRKMSFPELVRTANEHGLLRGNWSDWRGFRDMRNKTSHTYDRTVAIQVVKGIPRFIEEADHLCGKLREALK